MYFACTVLYVANSSSLTNFDHLSSFSWQILVQLCCSLSLSSPAYGNGLALKHLRQLHIIMSGF